MSTHDPISDLVTRIRNAQMRAKPKVSTPGSKMRANVLEVLKAEGYIRGYASVEHASGRSEQLAAARGMLDAGVAADITLGLEHFEHVGAHLGARGRNLGLGAHLRIADTGDEIADRIVR